MNTNLGSQRYIELYLICDFRQKINSIRVKHLFDDQINYIIKHICQKPVFLDKENALGYMRFVGIARCILHVYVPESAIEGQFDGLSIKEDSLDANQIHGCFLYYGKTKEYLANPGFDHNLLSLVPPKEELL
ncbi:MAG: hypothetical protein K2Q14_08085 [Gammaproteobacteria bacterium]|nr:hypothetical protein [Gammaproteobacteria bacterium]